LALGVANEQATVYGILGLMLVLVVGTILMSRVSSTPQIISD